MGKTTIEWTDATWNPVSGCTKVSSGCKNCYAERLFPRAYAARNDSATASTGEPGAQRPARRVFSDVRTHPERLDAPLHWRKPRRIFVNSMSDLFHEEVPDEFIERVFAVMALSRRHTYQILTKRPERMLRFCSALTSEKIIDRCNQSTDGGQHSVGAYNLGSISHLSAKKRFVEGGDKTVYWPLESPPLSNIWLGVSVEDQKTADERIPLLLQAPAAVRFVSYEPALGPVNFKLFLPLIERGRGVPVSGRGLNWIIAGGESGPNARPAHPDWFRSVRDQCLAAGIPFFFKQWGEWMSDSQVTDEMMDTIKGPRPIHNWPGIHAHIFANRALRIGKKAAGRLLDGREWNEFPRSAAER